MKIMTIIGTRPEIIRLSRVIKKLDDSCDHVLVHTGQNYDHNLNEIFFNELGVRPPDVVINSKSNSFGEQLSIIFKEIERVILAHKPDKVLILGDTNTSLSAIIVERLGYPVYHMEAGNRCFDLKVPEEKNRKIIDAISSFNLPYTPNSRENLIKEGFPKQRIFECGNPIYEVLEYYDYQIKSSDILTRLNLKKFGYLLVTIHRAENVDERSRLNQIWSALDILSKNHNIIFSCHPRTKAKILQFNINTENNIMLHEPFGFFDFVKLEQNARCVLTDSGTVQEECCIFNRPVVTVRDSTERPETVECGSNIVSGIETTRIINALTIMLKSKCVWPKPLGYTDNIVSDKVVNYILGNQLTHE